MRAESFREIAKSFSTLDNLVAKNDDFARLMSVDLIDK